MSANQPLLSYDSIQRIRQYVEMKFSHLPKEKHAEIVANAIVKVVEKQLPSFDYDTKKSITNEIIKQVVVNQQRPIQLSDIMNVVENHPLSDSDEAKFNSWKSLLVLQGESISSGDEVLNANQDKNIKFNNGLNAKNLYSINEVAASSAASVGYNEGQAPQIVTKNKKRKLTIIFSVAFASLLSLIIMLSQTSLLQYEFGHGSELASAQIEETEILELNLPDNELPKHYQYTEFDKEIIKAYLNTRHSLLADEPYFSAIYNTAREFNIHPVLLFAITGQEQGFVPRDHELADKIVQNPFNVFYSWKDYNTNIEDTTAIAARTLITLSKDRPEDVEAIKWINRKYAEDENWHKGVVWFYNTIVNYQTNE